MTEQRRTPSAAIVVAVLALVAALAGTAIAGPGVESSAVNKKDVKKIAKKQAKKQVKKLAPGLSVANADNAANAANAAQVDTLQVDPENVEAAASLAVAPEVELLTYGPFTVYGKCFVNAANISAQAYIKSTGAGALLDSDEDDLDGAGNGYLSPGTLEANRELENDVDALANDTDSSASDFDAVLGTAKLQGTVVAYAKQGTPPAGNGTYGAGNRCIFDAFGTQTGA